MTDTAVAATSGVNSAREGTRGSCHHFQDSLEEPQLAAALLRPASLNRNTFSRDAAGHLVDEVAGGVVEIQRERAAVRIAALT